MKPSLNPPPRRGRLFLASACFFLSLGLALVSTALSTLYLSAQTRTAFDIFWNEISGMALLMPLGALAIGITPVGWLFGVGFILLLKRRDPRWMLLPASAAILFGMWWPKLFWAWMSI